MKTYDKKKFQWVGNWTDLGDYYLQPIQHIETGSVVDILLDCNGNIVSDPNEFTNYLSRAFSLKGDHTKIIPIKINDQRCIAVIFPNISNN